MTKTRAATMTPQHVKAARALLGWSAEDLAALLPIGVATLRTFESGKDIKPASQAAIFDGLTTYGIRMRSGDRFGVHLVNPDTTERLKINLNKIRCPNCGTDLPMLRVPKSLRAALWGGGTCPKCGTEVSKFGRAI
ncbi:MAG: hypothetical protein ACU0A6_13900 [Shimia sp.]|uniref:hypothetical protein n=1 Tax=Shimia sp. TaxID=1954381 RepID=UPI004059C108